MFSFRFNMWHSFKRDNGHTVNVGRYFRSGNSLWSIIRRPWQGGDETLSSDEDKVMVDFINVAAEDEVAGKSIMIDVGSSPRGTA
jgi:hypothetical protein